MIYIASPYYHKSSYVRELRYLWVEYYVVEQLQKGLHVFSPVVYCHELAKKYGLPKDHEFWLELNKDYLSSSKKLQVLQLSGWVKSKGVTFEIAFAKELGIPIEHVVMPASFLRCLEAVGG